MKNQGISLISLIITIIVIIILAAIVIFTGLGTPDSANFAHYCQDIDNVQSAVLNAFASLKVQHATKNEARNDEQIYMEIALGDSAMVSQYDMMSTDEQTHTAATTKASRTAGSDQEKQACQNIVVTGDNGKAKSTVLNMTLPKVRESVKGWYITRTGRVFNATGYVYEGSTYYTSNLKDTNVKLNVNKTATYGARANKIAKALADGANSAGLTTAE